MTTFLRANPLFLAGFPPDFVDESGIPILEADTLRFPGYAGVVQYIPCSLNDARRESGLPMNMEALRRIQADPTLWKAAVHSVKQHVDLGGRSVLQRMFAVADAYYCLPYIIDGSRKGPLPLGPANLFRFFRGIAHYCRHRTLFGGDADRAVSMYQYAHDRRLFDSVRGVCPASKTLCDRIEKEFQVLLEADAGTHPFEPVCSGEHLSQAIILSSSFEQFSVLCALNFINVALARRAAGAPPMSCVQSAFPVPFLTWLKANLTDEVPEAFLAGLSAHAEGLPENADLADELLMAIEETRRQQGSLAIRRDRIVRLGHRLNLRVACLLGSSGSPDVRSFESAFDAVMQRNCPDLAVSA